MPTKKIPKLGILENVSLYFELHLDKCHMIVEYLLRHSIDKNPSQQLELLISLNDITRCPKCLSNENLCWFHSESVKTILINDTQNWFNELKTRH